jgi:hypothetical protein
VKAYDLNAKVYDHFLKVESREEKQYEAELASKAQDHATEQEKLGFATMMAWLDHQKELNVKDKAQKADPNALQANVEQS